MLTVSPSHRFTFSVPLLALLSQAPAQPLQYAETSTGISTPSWDGGRSGLAIADLNLDGHPDLVTVGDHGSPNFGTDMHGICVWFGDGANHYTNYQKGDFGYGQIAIGDLNNDGLPDAAWGVHHNYTNNDFGNGLTEAALGDGTGKNWTPWDNGLGQNGQDYGMAGTALADFNIDGRLDILSNAFGYDDGVHIYLNHGDGEWSQSFGFIGGNSTDDVAVGDVNADGYPDAAVAHQFGSILLNITGGDFEYSDTGLPGGGNVGRMGPSLADVNQDGRDDFSFATSSGGAQVYLRTQNNAWLKASTGLPTSGPFETTALADMDADGQIDLVAFGSGSVKVYRGDGGASWTEAASLTLPSPGYYSALAVGDMDHNGRPDIALVSEKTFGFNYKNFLHIFSEKTKPESLSALITRPTPHHALKAGSTTFIDWLAAIPAGDTATIALDLSITGDAGPWEPLAADLPNSGRHQLTVPLIPYTDHAYLRLTATTPTDQSITIRGPFTILSPHCYPDCDINATLDLFDFLCFQNNFNNHTDYADCDGNTTFDLFDFLCYTNMFISGC